MTHKKENGSGAAKAPAPAAAPAPAPPAKAKSGKLPPKNKHRLPRKLKKEQKKAATHL